MFRYDMHVHTCPCSGGGSDIREHIDALIEKGFAGMVVTNHFYYGDNRIDRDLPWDRFVDAYRQDYLYGLSYARERDFDLLFGVEEHVGDGREILIYGVTPDFLAAHPELKMASAEVYAEAVHAAGGMVFQSHPYRASRYVRKPFPLECLDCLDGIEVYNQANESAWNESAKALAEKEGYTVVAGSDAHDTDVPRAGIAANERIRTNEDLMRILKSGAYSIVSNV